MTIDDAHDEALGINDLLALVENIRPHLLNDQATADAIAEAEREAGVEWGEPLAAPRLGFFARVEQAPVFLGELARCPMVTA